MAKHGKKKIRFHFEDLQFASFFLDFIRRKKFYCRISGSMKYTGQLEFSIVGSSDSVRMGSQKIRKLYHKAYEKFHENRSFINYGNDIIDEELDEDLEKINKKNKDINLKFKLKNLKFNGA